VVGELQPSVEICIGRNSPYVKIVLSLLSKIEKLVKKYNIPEDIVFALYRGYSSRSKKISVDEFLKYTRKCLRAGKCTSITINI